MIILSRHSSWRFSWTFLEENAISKNSIWPFQQNYNCTFSTGRMAIFFPGDSTRIIYTYIAHLICNKLPSSWPRCRIAWACWRWAWTSGRLSLSVLSSCPLWTTSDFQLFDPSRRTPEKRPGNVLLLSPASRWKIWKYYYHNSFR